MGELGPSMDSRSRSGKAWSLSDEDLRTGDLGRILSSSAISLSVKFLGICDSSLTVGRGDEVEQFDGSFERNIMLTGIGSILGHHDPSRFLAVDPSV
jgi:hypothetical protein